MDAIEAILTRRSIRKYQPGNVSDELLKLLLEAGVTMHHVVKTTVFLADLANFDRLNELYREAFPTDRPARTCIQVARLPLDAAVEIEAIAVTGD